MPNKNYEAGRAFEYKVRNQWAVKGYEVMRTAGSHGPFDLIAVNPDQESVIFIQCKRCETEAEAKRLMIDFFKKPPFNPAKHTQLMVVYVKELRKQLEQWS